MKMGNNSNQNCVHGFKVFNSDWTCSPNGNTKQYTCPGKFEEDDAPIQCKRWMHFCKKAADCFNYYSFDPENKVAEVIAYGDITEEEDKCCTNKLEIVREIPWDEVLRIVNIGKACTGLRNTGGCNAGNRNTGDYNTGNGNTRDYNTGNFNTGNCNAGECNTGYYNAGDCNAGNRNTGSHNVGNYNAGNWNTGDYNTGNCNTGDWNKSSFNTGCFMTEEQKIFMFNKPSDWTYSEWLHSRARKLLNYMPKKTVTWICSKNMTHEEKVEHPTYEITDGYLKVLDESESGQIWWGSLSDDQKNIIKKLPNFDPEIFEQCTGIKVNLEEECREDGK